MPGILINHQHYRWWLGLGEGRGGLLLLLASSICLFE